MAAIRVCSLISLILVLVGGLFAQNGSLSVKIDRDTIGLDDVVKVEFILENLKGKFTPPDFSGFRVVSGPNYYATFSMINGKGRDYKSYQYLLAPQEAGTLEIGPATVSGESDELQTPNIIVFVENIASTRKGRDHQYQSKQNPESTVDERAAEKKKNTRKPLRRI